VKEMANSVGIRDNKGMSVMTLGVITVPEVAEVVSMRGVSPWTTTLLADGAKL